MHVAHVAVGLHVKGEEGRDGRSDKQKDGIGVLLGNGNCKDGEGDNTDQGINEGPKLEVLVSLDDIEPEQSMHNDSDKGENGRGKVKSVGGVAVENMAECGKANKQKAEA